MAFESRPSILKAGQRPARIRTGAKTATKTQEREYLEKFDALAQDFSVLVPEWLGPASKNPFRRLFWKLEKVQKRRDSDRRLRWAARGRHLWNGYAATLVVRRVGKIPSFASFKFRGHDVKFVYRTGTHRNALIGVQHYDDPEVRLLGYIEFAKKKGVLLISGDTSFVGLPRGSQGPTDVLRELLTVKGVAADEQFHCPHKEPDRPHYEYRVPDLGWSARLCMDCVAKIGGSFSDLLDTRILGPDPKIRVDLALQGLPFTLRGEAPRAAIDEMATKAFDQAKRYAKENFIAYSDLELAQWTKEHWLKLLDAREEGYLLVGDELWLADFIAAADAYADNEMERRALTTAFRLDPPRMRVGEKSLHKILEPSWKKHGRAILADLSGGLLSDQELAQIERLNPSEALTSLARVMGARERFKEFLQFESLDRPLEFVMDCLQIQRSGEHRILAEKLHVGASDDQLRTLTLALARGLGEQTGLEWQYAPHEKDAASFLEPYVRDVLNAKPADFAQAMTKLATTIGARPPKTKAPTA